MNAEQLNSARLARWSQNGEARLTLEAAAEWLDTIGFCPYLPAGLTGSPPSPSFLEAVVGRPAQTPSAGERSRANELLARMVENSAGVPLKLGHSLGEQPDFVASPEVLRYIYALRGDRNFKTGPSTVGNDKVTPLALHCWEAIQEQGPLDVFALQPILGRDMTEAAIARALQELWIGLYVFPVLSVTGKPAKWELLSRRFPQPIAAGASTGQAQSQSAMVSLYLHAVVAAAEEEVLAYLSPLSPQSKLREVMRGLGSMRQLDIIDIGGRAHVCLQGGLLPEMVAQLSEEQLGVATAAAGDSLQGIAAESIDSGTVTYGIGEDRIEIERETQPTYGGAGESRKFVPKKIVPKKFVPRDSGTGESAGKRFGARPPGARPGAGEAGRFQGSRSAGAAPSRPRSFAASAGGGFNSDRRNSGTRDFKRPSPDRPGFDARKPSTRGPGERAQRWEKSGEGVGGRAGADRPFERKPYKASGFKPAGFKSAGSGPAKSWASKGPRTNSEGAKPWVKRASFGSETSAEPRGRQRPGDSSGASASGYKKPYAAKSSAFRSTGSKPGGFSSGGAKPWARRSPADSGAGDPGERPKRWEKSDAGSGRPSSGGRAGFGARPAGKKPWGAKPAGARPAGRKPSGFTTSGFKSAGAKSAEGRSAGAKPWVSKGAESRVGSAKSYVARTSRSGEGAAPREPRKPYGKTDGAKPWTKRASAEGEAGDRPKRREKPDASAGKPGGKRDAKPFWAKNPRGGKGSVAASRTNRPRGGKKAGGKKGGKKK